MTAGDKRRLLKAFRNASIYDKWLLIINNNAAVLLGEETVLTEFEEYEITAAVTPGRDGQAFAAVLLRGSALNWLVYTIKEDVREATAALLHVNEILTSIRQYRCFEDLINDLCAGTSKRS